MSKKTLVAVAVLSAFAGSAFAADVTVYGLVDEGLLFQNVKKNSDKSENALSLESGIAGASRWGIKGTEKLGNGYSIAVNLEGKFTADDGAMGTSGQIFDRESHLQLNTPYGNVRVGRTGMLGGGVGGGLIAGQTNPFGVVYKTAGALNVFQGAAQRASNSIRYESPSMSGFRVYGQYSNATGLSTDYSEGDDAKPSSQRDRYAAVGATYRGGQLRVAAAVDRYLFNDVSQKDRDDNVNYSVAANYDFGDVKIYGGYQYAKAMRASVMGANAQKADGQVVMLGISGEVAGGTLMASAAYAYVDDTVGTTKYELDGWQAAVGYKYPLSKRTFVYSALSYRDTDLTKTTNKVTQTETKTTQAMVGMQHKF